MWSVCLCGVCACLKVSVLHVCWLPWLQGRAGIDDVLACQVDTEGAVNIKDTFNLQDGRSNLIDDPHIEAHNVRKRVMCMYDCA